MEKIEREIYRYLEKNRGKKFNALEIGKAVKHGYPAILKYTLLLHAKGLIEVEDYGNNKQISFKEVEGDGL